MKRIQISEFGGPEVLQIVEQDDIGPGLDEVTVDVEYIGVGLVDSLLRKGIIELAFPFVPGLEVSGYVREVGENVTELKVGQPVALPLLLSFGGYATIAKAHKTLVIPLNSSDELKSAAAVVVNFTTAHLLFNDIASALPHHNILIHGASGGLGTACCKLAKAMGVGFLAASTSSEAKRPYLESLGCDKVVLSQQLRSQFPELEGDGFDIVVDPVGGNVRRESVDLLKQRGKLLVVGSADNTEDVMLSSNSLWLGNREVVGVNIGAMCAQNPERVVASAKKVLDMIAKGQITEGPVKVLPFDEVAEAHRLLDGKSVQGKIVLRA